MNPELNALATSIGTALKQRNLKMATAESCTGGGLSYCITQIAGSSDWFERGFVTYSNQAKIDMLGVKQSTLDAFGAVSEQTAREMAEGALKHSKADVCIAITGIAGPAGGSAEKPVGTVWIAWAARGLQTQSFLSVFPGDREHIRLGAIKMALANLMVMLHGIDRLV